MLLASLVLALAIGAIGATVAQATTFCVGGSGCSGTSEPDLQSALSAAQSDPAPPSAVQLGAGTFSSPSGFHYSASHQLTLTGAGTGETMLTATTAKATVVTLSGASSPINVSAITIAVPKEGVGTNVLATTFRHIAVIDAPGQAGFVGVGINGTTSQLLQSTVTMSAAAEGVSGSGTIQDDQITARLGVIGSELTVQRSIISASETAVECEGGSCTFDSNLVKLGPSATVGVLLANTGTSTKMLADGVTVIGGGPATIAFEAFSGFAGITSTLTVDDSIVSGAGHATAEEAIEPGAKAILTVGHSDLDTSTNELLGLTAQDTFTQGTGIVNVAPGFVNSGAGQYQLAYNSPLIDIGDPLPLESNESTTDLAGNPRLIDGDGDGDAAGTDSVQDIGAYEYQRAAPTAVAHQSSTTAAAGQAVTFDGGGSSDPDPGDTLTYAWHFDDGASAATQVASHAFATPGNHVATLTVTDPTGLTGSASVTVAVPAPPGSSSLSSGNQLPPAVVNPFVSVLHLVRAKLKGIVRRGVRALVTCSAACRATLSLTIDPTTARRARVSAHSNQTHKGSKAHKPVVVGRMVVMLTAKTPTSVRIPLTGRAARLGKLQKVTLTLTANVTAPGGGPVASAKSALTYRH
jgi:hypothetical protein